MTGKNEREEISLERLMGLKIHPFSYECCSFFFLSFFSEKYLPKFYRRFWKEGIVLSGVKSRLADAIGKHPGWNHLKQITSLTFYFFVTFLDWHGWLWPDLNSEAAEKRWEQVSMDQVYSSGKPRHCSAQYLRMKLGKTGKFADSSLCKFNTEVFIKIHSEKNYVI